MKKIWNDITRMILSVILFVCGCSIKSSYYKSIPSLNGFDTLVRNFDVYTPVTYETYDVIGNEAGTTDRGEAVYTVRNLQDWLCIKQEQNVLLYRPAGSVDSSDLHSRMTMNIQVPFEEDRVSYEKQIAWQAWVSYCLIDVSDDRDEEITGKQWTDLPYIESADDVYIDEEYMNLKGNEGVLQFGLKDGCCVNVKRVVTESADEELTDVKVTVRAEVLADSRVKIEVYASSEEYECVLREYQDIVSVIDQYSEQSADNEEEYEPDYFCITRCMTEEQLIKCMDVLGQRKTAVRASKYNCRKPEDYLLSCSIRLT